MYRFNYPEPVVFMDVADPTKRMTKEMTAVSQGRIVTLPTDQPMDPLTLFGLWADDLIKDPELVKGDAAKAGLAVGAINSALWSAEQARRTGVAYGAPERVVALEDDHFERFKKLLTTPSNPFDARRLFQMTKLIREVTGALDDLAWREKNKLTAVPASADS